MVCRRLWKGDLEVWAAVGHHERRGTWLDGLDAQVRKDQGKIVAVRLDVRLVERKPEFTRPSPGLGGIRRLSPVYQAIGAARCAPA